MTIQELRENNLDFNEMWNRFRNALREFETEMNEQNNLSTEKEISDELFEDLVEYLRPMSFLSDSDFKEVTDTYFKDFGDMTDKWSYEQENWRQVLVFCPDCLRRMRGGIDAFEIWGQFVYEVMMKEIEI